MKIISWNLKNIGQTKLANPINGNIAAAGYGNTVLDFMMRVVMGGGIWAGVNSLVPADIFLVIELKSGGHNKSQAAFGTATPTITAITQAMNVVAAAFPFPANAHYHYTFVNPLITGHHECVGVIFNDRLLTYVASGVLRDNMNRYLNPRSPFYTSFTLNATAQPLNVIGIHAPPPQGALAVRYKNPISFCVKLPTIPFVMQALPQETCIGGDFNCDPTSVWVNNGVATSPFTNLAGYATGLPNNTLTSVRKKLDNSQPGPGRYLGAAYDNLLYKLTAAPNGEYTMDLIGNVNALGVGLLAKLNSYWVVSDHLPVAME
jgi:hypothetical protein